MKQNTIAEAQITINKLQIDDIHAVKYDMAKNKITSKHIIKPTKRTPKTKTPTEYKKQIIKSITLYTQSRQSE